MAFYLLNPGSRCGNAVEIKHIGVQDLVEVYVAVVTLYNLCFGLQCAHNLTYAPQFLGSHLGGLVQQHDVAELNLLDDEVFDVFLVNIRARKQLSALELIAHTQGINHGDDAVEPRQTAAGEVHAHRRDGADGLGDGAWLTDAAGLYHDIVEALHGGDVHELLHEVHLQRAADAAVLQGHQAVVLLVDDASLLNECCVDVHLADVVDNHGKLDAFLVCQDAIQ